MQTKNTYCGDGWEFEIDTEIFESPNTTDKKIDLRLKGNPTSIAKWELEELADFLKKYLETH